MGVLNEYCCIYIYMYKIIYNIKVTVYIYIYKVLCNSAVNYHYCK